MRFSEPYLLLLLPIILIAVPLLWITAARRRGAALKLLLGNSADDPAAVHLSHRARRGRCILLLLALVLTIVGAARPYWDQRMVETTKKGLDLLVLFDVSKSMRIPDPAPSRLEHAKFLLRQLISALPQDRFGLIAFAGNAFLSCPLTDDAGALREYVDELSTDSVPLGGTNVERALRVADKAFTAAEGENRAVILLTDGDELTGQASRLIDRFRERKIPLIVVGFGDPAIAAPVPDGKGGIMRGADGTPAASRLNEAELKKLASSTGGIYVHSTVTDTGISAIEARLAQMKRLESGGTKRFLPEERFPLFFGAAALLLLLSSLISERPFFSEKKRNAKLPLILAGIVFASPAALSGQEPPAPLPAAEAENKAEAAAPLPADPAALYNLARRRQQSGEAGAEELYEQVIRASADRPALSGRALQNLGVCRHEAARKNRQSAQQMLAAEQLDPAEKELKNAENAVNGAQELYVQALALDQPDGSCAADLRQLELDRRQIEKLKKQIKKLKETQKQARQQSKQAQQQNKDQQQKQQQQNKDQQKPQDQQQTQAAQQAAKELEKQAKELKQEKLAEQARQAAQELEKAEQEQRRNRPDEAQKHLDRAVRTLGEPQAAEPQKKSEKQPVPGEKKEEKQTQAAADAAERQKNEEKKKEAARRLQMLKNEGQELRDNLRRRRSSQQPAVEKDW